MFTKKETVDMLIILVGGTLQVGKSSREYFKEKGYSVIQKYNYYPENHDHFHYDAITNYPEEMVMQCDFTYTIHGSKTGFNKAQILDAVRGRCNALITMSPSNLDFVREIKDTFGEYVLVVYLYIDKASLETVTRQYVTVESEVQMRLQTGVELRKTYLANMNLFDKTVIYSAQGEFDLEALYDQYDLIIQEAEEIQKKANRDCYVDLPYKGNLPYVFVSYSHRDARRVLPYLSGLQRAGYRVWYDEGIRKGANWMVMLGERLKACTNFLLFSSEHSVSSKHVIGEINGALQCDTFVPIIVRLDERRFDFGIEMYLSQYQHIEETNGHVLEEIKSALDPTTKVANGQ